MIEAGNFLSELTLFYYMVILTRWCRRSSGRRAINSGKRELLGEDIVELVTSSLMYLFETRTYCYTTGSATLPTSQYFGAPITCELATITRSGVHL